MTNMIKTPLGQYINKDEIEIIYVIGNGYTIAVKTGVPSLTRNIIEDKPTTAYIIEARYKSGNKQTLSPEYKTKEEAQKELDNMMSHAPNYSGINKDLIKDKHLLIQCGAIKFFLKNSFKTPSNFFFPSNCFYCHLFNIPL